MKSLKVLIEISGASKLVGHLFYSNALDTVFKYDASYLEFDKARPISISLPLQEESFTAVQTKNFSLLYSSDLKSVRLAPAYDIVSTTVYKQSTRNLSIYMGNECLIDNIDKAVILKAAQQVGIGKGIAERVLDTMAKNFEQALILSSKELQQQGFENADSIADLILRSGGIAKLN